MVSVNVPIMKRVKRDGNVGSQEWKVYYSGNFWGHEKGERRCREIVVEKKFTWAGQNWRIPSIYTCPRGLVIDFCAEVPAEEIKAFMEKWNLWDVETESETAREYTEEESMRLDAENPLSFGMTPYASVNGRQLQGDHGCSVSWNPCPPDGIVRELEAKEALTHYQCDPKQGWIFIRYAFRWSDKTESRRAKTPVIRELKLSLKADAVQVAGPHFCTICKVAADSMRGESEKRGSTCQADGNETSVKCMTESEEFDFTHPVTGEQYKLQVASLERGELPESSSFINDDMDRKHCAWIEGREWPRRFIQMEYTIAPELPDVEFYLTDCARCDQPREKVQENGSANPKSKGAAAVAVIVGADKPEEKGSAESESAETAIIGGADGSTSIFICGKGRPKTHLACSAPHFEWVDKVEWRMVFHKQVREIKEVVLDHFS